MNNALEALSIYTKIAHCKESADEIIKTSQDSNLSTAEKTAEIATQGIFIALQTTEIVLKNNVLVAPIINSLNGVADITKTGFHSYIHKEDLEKTSIEIGTKTISYSAEALNNLMKNPKFKDVPSLQALSSLLNTANLGIKAFKIYRILTKDG